MYLFLFTSQFSLAQVGVAKVKTFHLGVDYKFTKVLLSQDGNYVALGANENYSSERATLVKCDTAFNIIWETDIDIYGYELYDVVQTSDGGYIACGTNKNLPEGRAEDAFVVKFDKDGDVSWQKFYGGTDQDFGHAIRQLPNGHYLLLAEVNSTDGVVSGKPSNSSADIWLVELDASGNIISQKFFGGSGADSPTQMELTNDGGLIFTGSTASIDGEVTGNHDNEHADVWVVKLNSSYNIEWSKCFGGTDNDGGTSVCKNTTGGYIVTGNTKSGDGDFHSAGGTDAFISSLDGTGTVQWLKEMTNAGGAGTLQAKVLSNGDLITIGYSEVTPIAEVALPADHAFGEGILLRLNNRGSILWSKSIGGGDYDLASDALVLPNGNLLVSGAADFLGPINGDFAGLNNPHEELDAFLMEVRNLNTIKGNIFYDLNNNNVKDAGDDFITNGEILTSGQNLQMKSYPLTGTFYNSVDSGKYTTAFNNYNSFHVFDPAQFAITPKSKQSNFTGTNQTDSFSFRVAPIGLVKDLAVNITRLSEAYIDNSAKFRIIFQNLGGASIDTAGIELSTSGLSVYQSSDKQIFSNNNDKVTWRYFNVAAFEKDTINITVHLNTVPFTKIGDSLTLSVLAYPFTTDFDSVDNRASVYSVIKGQNDALSNTNLTFAVTDSARIKRSIPYNIVYNFNSLLDSTKGEIRVVKDAKTTYESSLPAPSLIQGDTLLWYFKNLQYNNADTIKLILAVSDTPAVHIGNFVQQQLSLKFYTTDTTVILLQRNISQQITGYFVPLDNTNTSLVYPNGLRWTRSFGGSKDDFGNDVIGLPDSGFIIVGSTKSKDFDIVTKSDSLDAFIARYDRDGHVKWVKTFGSPLDDAFLSVAKANDGNFFASGYTGVNYFDSSSIGDAWVVKFNIDGDTIWTKKYGGSKQETIYSIASTGDGGCIFTGDTESNDGDVSGYFQADPIYKSNMWVVKLNSTGAIEWQRCYTDSIYGSHGLSIKVLADKNYLVGSNTNAKYTDGWYKLDAAILKLNSVGNKIWEKKFDDASLEHSIASLLENADGTLMLAGNINTRGTTEDQLYSGVHGGQQDVWIARLDNDGTKIWEKFFGGNSFEDGDKIIQVSDGNYIVAANTSSYDGNVTGFHQGIDAWLLKIDGTGKLLWQKTVGGIADDFFRSVTELNDGSILAAGYTNTNNDGDVFGGHGNYDVLIAKTGQANLITGKVFFDRNKNLVQDGSDVPVNKGIAVASKGNLVYSGVITNGRYSISVDTGSYMIRIVTADSAYYNINPGVAISNFSGYVQTDTIDFALARKKDIQDLRIDLLATNTARPGFNTYYVLNYENKGTIPVNNTSVYLILDPRTDYLSSDIPYSGRNGDTLTWNTGTMEDLAVSQAINIQLKVKPPPVVNSGDSLVLTARILPLANDTLPSDNQVIIKQQVRGAVDPNGKEEIHGNSLPADKLQNSEYLTYIIRFQNTGTDTAFGVRVRDTLNSNLDWNSLEMINTSSSYELTIKEGNKLEWYFRNILLPDSNVNEQASHGFLAFRIQPKKGLAVGDSITNKAAVYFDFNLPVATNIARTFISPLEALPSSILTLEGKRQQNTILIKWVVTNEVNVNYYQVERSSNGADYLSIGSVTALNKNTVTSYTFTDDAAPKRINYYRLKIVDIDGRVGYSHIVVINGQSENFTCSIFPNPANDKVFLAFDNVMKGSAILSLADMQGNILFTQNLGYITTNVINVPFNLKFLSAGVYIIKCKIGEQLFTGKLIKN